MFVFRKNATIKIVSPFVLILVFMAFAVKSIIPAGFMPIVNKDGFTQIVICSGMGEKTITVPSDSSDPAHHKSSDKKEICAFQVLASGKYLITSPFLVAFALTFTNLGVEFLNDQSYETIALLYFSPRGPPAFII